MNYQLKVVDDILMDSIMAFSKLNTHERKFCTEINKENYM